MGSLVKECIVQLNSSIFMINLQTWICFCYHYQKNDISCDHIMICIFTLSQFLDLYLLFILSVTVWTAIYFKSMIAVNVSNLCSVNNMKCNPLHTHVPCRRSKKKQIQTENMCALYKLHQNDLKNTDESLRQKNAVHYCSICHQIEHNASTCCRPHN